MEEQIQKKLTLLQIEQITRAQAREYNESPAIHHTVWNMRGEECTPCYFADLIESSIDSTGRCYQVEFKPFAIHCEPIIHRPGHRNYYFCRAHVYTRK
jgi:hypothetical protein